MKSAPTSGAESTAATDIAANAQTFARYLRAGNEPPNTIKAYLDAVFRLDGLLDARGMPCKVATIHREHAEAFVKTSSPGSSSRRLLDELTIELRAKLGSAHHMGVQITERRS